MADCMTKAYLDIFPNGITRDLVDAHVGTTWAKAKKGSEVEFNKIAA